MRCMAAIIDMRHDGPTLRAIHSSQVVRANSEQWLGPLVIPVGKLIEALQRFPPDALARVFEGVVDGVVIVASTKNAHGGRDQLGCIKAVEHESHPQP